MRGLRVIGVAAVGALLAAMLSASGAQERKGPPGKAFKIDVHGSFYPQTPAAAPATSIPLADMNLGEEDYVGVSIVGEYTIKNTHEKSGVSSGVFRSGESIVPPGDYGTPFPAADAGCTTQANGFHVVPKNVFIQRIPIGATALEVNPYGCPAGGLVDADGDYSLRITRPNSPPLGKGKTAQAAADAEATPDPGHEPGIPDEALARFLAAASGDGVVNVAPRAKGLEALCTATVPPMPHPQYRGWHRSATCSDASCWKPRWSRYDPDGQIQPEGHKGVDIFAPETSDLRAPVSGKLIYRRLPEWGNVAGIAFTLGPDNAPYVILLAHLRDLKPGFQDGQTVNQGDMFAMAGCSGDAAHEWCKKETPEGGRSDHVHVELLKGSKILHSNKAKRYSPTRLCWSIKTPG